MELACEHTAEPGPEQGGSRAATLGGPPGLRQRLCSPDAFAVGAVSLAPLCCPGRLLGLTPRPLGFVPGACSGSPAWPSPPGAGPCGGVPPFNGPSKLSLQ